MLPRLQLGIVVVTGPALPWRLLFGLIQEMECTGTQAAAGHHNNTSSFTDLKHRRRCYGLNISL